MALREKPGGAVVHLQRPRHVVLFRSLLAFRIRDRRVLRGGRRGRRRAHTSSGKGSPGSGATYRLRLDGGRVRFVVFSGSSAGPWLLLAFVHAVAAPAVVARSDHPIANRRPAIPDSVGGAVLQAGLVAEESDRELPGGSEGGD